MIHCEDELSTSDDFAATLESNGRCRVQCEGGYDLQQWIFCLLIHSSHLMCMYGHLDTKCIHVHEVISDYSARYTNVCIYTFHARTE